MRLAATIFLLTVVAARAQFGFTPQQMAFLDARYGGDSGTNTIDTSLLLTTTTTFGGQFIFGKYNNLYLNTTNIALAMAGSNVTANSGRFDVEKVYTPDGDTITNDANRQISVAFYSSNTFARLAYRMNTRLSWNDFEPGHINDTDFSEAEPGAPLEFDWSDLE